ncbi:unnamed protein product [Cylicostephanus goldi]|uniref:Uncharacterized protein n=1 Tax=Cylicostephanus goldi TaxID=71465 RepID=A0A3P6SZJ2_CYLGO|nr:unnamed protein product [Cylicostephanus goldi]
MYCQAVWARRQSHIIALYFQVFAIDINKNTKKLETFDSSEKLGPRYSSQPTLGANKDASTTHDVSVVESNMYHEIDSFLVPPVVDLRIATLV